VGIKIRNADIPTLIAKAIVSLFLICSNIVEESKKLVKSTKTPMNSKKQDMKDMAILAQLLILITPIPIHRVIIPIINEGTNEIIDNKSLTSPRNKNKIVGAIKNNPIKEMYTPDIITNIFFIFSSPYFQPLSLPPITSSERSRTISKGRQLVTLWRGGNAQRYPLACVLSFQCLTPYPPKA